MQQKLRTFSLLYKKDEIPYSHIIKNIFLQVKQKYKYLKFKQLFLLYYY
jgi:hypothetical protein